MKRFVSQKYRLSGSPLGLYALISDLKRFNYLDRHEMVERIEATHAECFFHMKGLPVPLGFRIVDRQPYVMVKYELIDEEPFPLTAWIQIQTVGEGASFLRVTVDMDVPLIFAAMLPSDKIQEGLDSMAQTLAKQSF